MLVVDDNVDAADSLAMMLQIYGHRVRTAFDGEGALSAVRAERPDAVVLDIGLPQMDGYEVARRLRAEPGGERILLIALTGYGQAGDRQKAMGVGFDHHLVKPVDPAALQRLLAEPRKG